ncbi:MAG TPA: hypothetical protein VEI97_09010, partial [bacterium]|nr:hypothetical protein [bacterium]
LFDRGLSGGRTAALEYIQSAADAGNDSARKFMEAWNGLAVRRKEGLSWEIICTMAGVKVPDLVGAVIWTAQQHAANVAKLKAVTALPDVVDTLSASARSAEGFQDRKLLLESQKFVERGPSVVIDQSHTTEQHLHLPALEDVLSLGAAEPRSLPPAPAEVQGELIEE